MFRFPRAAEPLIGSLSIAFTRPTVKRFATLLVGAILAQRRRTITEVQWTARGLIPGHFCSFSRVFSRAKWSLWPLGKVLTQHVLQLVPEHEPIVVPIDDTVTRHSGPKVHGRGCHRDAVRSSHGITTICWGHRWVVLTVLVKMPLISRPWALPVLCALYRPRKVAEAEGCRFRTPCELAAILARVLMRWFPRKNFVFLGDGGFSSFDLATHIHRHGGTLVARYYDDAAIYEPAPPITPGRMGRPPIKGKSLPRPKQAADSTRSRHTTIPWYGGKQRRVELVHGDGMWYRSGRGVIAVRWVRVRDRGGTHRDEYLFTTAPSMRADRIAALYTRRWSIEVSFQECRAHLGLEDPRCRVRAAVLRLTPCLFGLYSVVALTFAEHIRLTGMKTDRAITTSRPWYVKREPTFIDALELVRRLLRAEVLTTPPQTTASQNLPPGRRNHTRNASRSAA